MPEVRDYWLPWEGVFHNIVVVSLDKEYPGHAQKLMSGLWGQGQMSFCKAITVVDRDTPPSNTGALIDLLLTRLDLSADTILTKGVLDVLDHSAPSANFGAKIGIDLTRRFAGEPERRIRALPPLSGHRPDPVALRSRAGRIVSCRPLFMDRTPSDPIINRFLAVSVERTPAESGGAISDELASLEALFPFNVIVIYDQDIDLSDGSLLLWKLFNNVDPTRDMRSYEGRILIDACKKGPADGHTRPWPDDLRFEDTGA
jgi:4-hydroxy-3-polyprenylbenzoate decarboxylase